MKKLTVIASLLACVIAINAEAGEILKKGELLNLDRAIEIAKIYHPNISSAKSTLDVSSSRVLQAESGYYPQIDLTAGYTRIRPSLSGSSAPASAASASGGSSYDQYAGNLSLKQMIYDFGKTKTQVDIQGLNVEASREDLSGITDSVVFNVKQAYFGVLRAKRSRDVSEETVKQYQKHLEQAKGFFEAGTKPRFDVTKAEVDLSNARLNMIKAENGLKVAYVTLNNAMGIPDAPEGYMLEDILSYQKYPLTVEDALGSAYKKRPDLRALETKKSAAEKNIELLKKGYYPFITGSASYTRSGESFPLHSSWNVGASLSLPVFSGYLTKNQIEEAKAALEVIKFNEESLRQAILLEVRQDYLLLYESEERIAVTELAVRQAIENFEIANGRYAAGVGNPIEVTDAEVSLANARAAHIQALYDYKVAKAAIEKATGTR